MTDVFLLSGEYYVGGADATVSTVLGSCVSMVLWNGQRRIGAMSHCLLSSRGPSTAGAADARYADEALTLMLRDLTCRGIRPERCVAKLFGGGRMFPRHTHAVDAVGEKNAEAVRRLVKAHGIPIVAEDLCGTGHRQLVFQIATGDVWMRRVDVDGSVPAGK